jgi:hypothetical protein
MHVVLTRDREKSEKPEVNDRVKRRRVDKVFGAFMIHPGTRLALASSRHSEV